MPNYEGTRAIVRQFLAARVPLIVIHSTEPTRVINILRDVAEELQSMPFFEFSTLEGLIDLRTRRKVNDDSSLVAVLDTAKQMFKTRQNANYVFSDLEGLGDDNTTSRRFSQMVRLAEPHQGSLILIVDKPVWSGLARLGMTTSLDLPDIDELTATLTETIDQNRTYVQIGWDHADIRRAAEILSGVTEAEAVNVLATMLAKRRITKDDIPELSQFKDRIFGAMTGIERVKLREDYKVGGLSNLKMWLKKREALIKSDLTNSSLHPPKGVLLCGVPGCGKSLSAKAIAYEWGLPLYRLDMGSVFGMYVGESEANLREALAAADRVAPCVLWIDEIEKGLATSDGGGGVTKRIIGQFLFWLQESTSKVFIVATANDVSTLPPELLRKGRFDEIFFVDLPTPEERAEILQLCFRKYTNQLPDPTMLDTLVYLSDGFAGSDIDAAVHDIASDMFASGSSALPDASYISAVFSNVMPFSRSNPEEIAAIRDWGENRAIPAGDIVPVAPSIPSAPPARRVVL